MSAYKQFVVFYLSDKGHKKWEVCWARSARDVVRFAERKPTVRKVLECYRLVEEWKWK